MFGWGGFWIVTLIWGSLYLLSRIGLESIDPTHLSFIRLGIAGIGLNLIIIARKLPIPRDLNTLLHLIAEGIGGVLLPVFLLSWGLQTVESGIGSVLQATAAVFAAVFAHFIFEDERLSPIKFIGVIISFIGVIVLTQRNMVGDATQSSIEGQIAIIIGALLYAAFTIHSRFLMRRNIKPVVVSGISVLVAVYGMGIFMVGQILVGDLPATASANLTPTAILVILTLGFVQTFLAYVLYYEVVANIGAAKSTMVTYTIPPVALLLGVIFGGEVLDGFIITGTSLIFLGIGFTKLKFNFPVVTIRPILRPKMPR